MDDVECRIQPFYQIFCSTKHCMSRPDLNRSNQWLLSNYSAPFNYCLIKIKFQREWRPPSRYWDFCVRLIVAHWVILTSKCPKSNKMIQNNSVKNTFLLLFVKQFQNLSPLKNDFFIIYLVYTFWHLFHPVCVRTYFKIKFSPMLTFKLNGELSIEILLCYVFSCIWL